VTFKNTKTFSGICIPQAASLIRAHSPHKVTLCGGEFHSVKTQQMTGKHGNLLFQMNIIDTT
jgi:hypothetical protein